MSPRQRMINLMYIVLTAMLAINVSSDVIDGFRHVGKGLEDSNAEAASRVGLQLRELESAFSKNPEKARDAHEKGTRFGNSADSLIAVMENLKSMIAMKADGKVSDPVSISKAQDLHASPSVMLDSAPSNAEKLGQALRNYALMAASLIPDTSRHSKIHATLLSGFYDGGKMFSEMSAIAAVAMLSKIQNDVRQIESEVLAAIMDSVDAGDARVNTMQAYVIPQSQMVMRGGEYSADVVVAAADTTCAPKFFINGNPLPDGKISIRASGSGISKFSGYAETQMPRGGIDRMPFEGSFTVIDPVSTVSATMMNVLYAGIDNPVSISVPGVPMQSVAATMTNGTLEKRGDRWIARPSKIGSEAEIKVTASVGGKTISVGSTKFRVRKLPDPTPYIPVKDAQGNVSSYKGSPRRISKSALNAAGGLGAAIDDGVIDVAFSVVSFSTVMLDQLGNAIPEVSDGESFSKRQKDQIKRLKPGKSFFITNIKAKGPDGITRNIPPMEVSMN